MAYATLDDLLVVEPTIQDYGVLDWEAELTRSENEINRVLKVRWYLPYSKKHNSTAEFDSTLITDSQFTQAAVYHALGYHIYPKLSAFTEAVDIFERKMQYYQGRFEHEMDLILREGVLYDLDDDGTVEKAEKAPVVSLRLRR